MIKNILIVEDDPGDQKLIKLALKKYSDKFNLVFIDDGEQAIEYLKNYDSVEHKPQLVLLDLNLPKVSGIEILNFIKSGKKLKEIPVVILTTSQAERTLNSEIVHFAKRYYTKPPTIQEFFFIFERMFKYDLKTYFE